ncbi:hypothetical protein, partial [Caenispirillum salinarum]|uniref:hypothetical protein n=1 Tax=Caenispirillum salinarum TaxID=859058 RepID=UPI000690194A
MRFRRALSVLAGALVAALWLSSTPAAATVTEANVLAVTPAPLPQPDPGPTVLTVAGAAGVQEYDVADLEALGPHALEADLVWQDESDVYHGVLLSDVLADAGLADVPAVRVRALDGYSAVIPRADWRRWPILLATRRGGDLMPVRGKGPLRILYPLTPDAVLAMPQMDTRWVWMVEAIEPEPA